MIPNNISNNRSDGTKPVPTKESTRIQSKTSSAEYKRFEVKSADETILERVLELVHSKTQIRGMGGFNHPIFII